MTQPTWQEITAEAIRRKAQALEDGRGVIELEALIVEITREGWKPPPTVDPDLLAWREWAATIPNHPFREEVLAGKWDRSEAARGFVAGARMARKQEREREKVLVSRFSDLILRVEEDWALGDVTGINASEMISAREALAKYRGEA